ncbi:MAG: ATP-binding protein [Thermoleophilaceae bacterium]
MRAFQWNFVAEPQAVQAARHRVDELELEGAARRLLTLLVSELVTNSVRHAAGSSIGLAVEIDDGMARVEVIDAGAGFAPPPAPRPGEQRPSGWGLYLVERFADRWGVSADGPTCVWFEIDRDRSAA